MKTDNPTNFDGITEKVKAVLTNEWQTTSIIASQIDFPPDALARRVKNQKVWGHGLTTSGAKSSMTGQVMYFLRKQGFVEYRKVTGKRYEYRLAKPKNNGGVT